MIACIAGLLLLPGCTGWQQSGQQAGGTVNTSGGLGMAGGRLSAAPVSTAGRAAAVAKASASGQATTAAPVNENSPPVARNALSLAPVQIVPAGRVPDIPVLMYHDVLPQKQVWFDETLDEFRTQMKAIHDRGFTVISTMQLWQHLAHGAPVPTRSIVLTFDDASEGQFKYALPALQQYHYPATFFIHTGYVGVTTSKEHLTWDQLHEAEATGLIDVEARTVTHPCNMPDLSPGELERELTGGIAAVRLHLGHESHFFSFPCGHHNEKSESAVRSAGYWLAFDEERGFANHSPSLFAVNRFTPRRFDEALTATSG